MEYIMDNNGVKMSVKRRVTDGAPIFKKFYNRCTSLFAAMKGVLGIRITFEVVSLFFNQ